MADRRPALPKVLLAAIVVFAAAPLSAQQPEEPCLETAVIEISPGQDITIVSSDEVKLSGRLKGIDLEHRLLTLVQIDAVGVTTHEFRPQQITQIKYKRAGRIKPLYGVIGFFVGLGLGHLIDREIIDSGADKDLVPRDFERHGAFIGATAGLVAGLALSPLLPSTRTINCP